MALALWMMAGREDSATSSLLAILLLLLGCPAPRREEEAQRDSAEKQPRHVCPGIGTSDAERSLGRIDEVRKKKR